LQAGLDITPVITDRFGYAEHADAFAAARSGQCGKIIIDWTRETVH
jgi:threonine 3-dehydrogenase